MKKIFLCAVSLAYFGMSSLEAQPKYISLSDLYRLSLTKLNKTDIEPAAQIASILFGWMRFPSDEIMEEKQQFAKYYPKRYVFDKLIEDIAQGGTSFINEMANCNATTMQKQKEVINSLNQMISQ